VRKNIAYWVCAFQSAPPRWEDRAALNARRTQRGARPAVRSTPGSCRNTLVCKRLRSEDKEKGKGPNKRANTVDRRENMEKSLLDLNTNYHLQEPLLLLATRELAEGQPARSGPNRQT